MSFFPAADFRLRSMKPHTTNLVLTEEDATDDYLDLVIAEVGSRVELDLDDDFEPPEPDADETIDIDGNGLHILVPPTAYPLAHDAAHPRRHRDAVGAGIHDLAPVVLAERRRHRDEPRGGTWTS